MFNALIDGKDGEVSGIGQSSVSEESLQIIQHRDVPVGIDPQPIDDISSRGVNQRPVDCFAHMIEEIIALISKQLGYFWICHSLIE